MTAAKNGHLDVVKFLMERGTNLFLKDKNGDTAIIIATENDHAEIATMLKQAGAKYIAKPKKEKKTQPAEEIEDDEDLELIDTPDVEDLPADEDDEEFDELEDED